MKDKFNYSYSAPTENERKEIEYIKKQYISKSNKDKKLEELRRLDKKVNAMPTCVALILGIVGIMVFGLGMTFVLEWQQMILGVILGAIGIIPMVGAYFTYNALYAKLKAKYSPEIIRLSNELLEGKDE